jgi:glucose-6-phosphate isomerase
MIKFKKNVPDRALVERIALSAQRLANLDTSLWGLESESEAKIRLGWVNLPATSRTLLPEIDALSAWARSKNLTRVLLCGMGGSSLAPEVICANDGREIVILDSTDPGQVLRHGHGDLTHTIIVLGSKSGSTIETDSQRRFFESTLISKGLNLHDHFVVVSDPGSPLSEYAINHGLKFIQADPNVGGRFSALSAFGLVPSALAGVDISVLLDDAAEVQLTGLDSPAVLLAAALIEHSEQNPFVEIVSKHGLGNWIEQLVAESTGKAGRGILPIVKERFTNHVESVLKISLVDDQGDISISASLGEQFMLWEIATALFCAELGINPFDQPNVAEAKDRTNKILDNPPTESTHVVDENLKIYNSSGRDLREALNQFFSKSRGYIGVTAFLDREELRYFQNISELIEQKSKQPCTFGWGPRYLHSTGQFHKGGPLIGSFLQITCSESTTLEVPGRDFTFGQLISAQAAGDAAALMSRDLNFLRIDISGEDIQAGLNKIVETIRSL